MMKKERWRGRGSLIFIYDEDEKERANFCNKSQVHKQAD